ncbi:hypothetical protein D5125_16965 [Magnetovirga frankeli]|uniref:putative iron-sulfur cluster-binding metallochaperone n=1 Tax=Magnetovirga frankeli TaxID=947516 RepID=UPI001AF0801B|nr:hypothetical protein D5125_16965 [gamma proteobacterium SS-5]
MSSCCSSGTPGVSSNLCPDCGDKGRPISWHWVLLHLKAPWQWADRAGDFNFCANPSCDTIYFASTGTCVYQADIRTQVGLKSASPQATVCYCYGISKEQSVEPSLRQFVIAQTQKGQCACEARNPSGRCCLADFPRPEGADVQ